MDIARQLAEVLANAAAAKSGGDPTQITDYQTKVAAFVENFLSAPLLPKPRETVAVTLERKTAALFFDRVWDIPHSSNGIPEDIRVWGATEAEIWPLALNLARQCGDISPNQFIDLFNQHAGLIAQLYGLDGEPTRLIAESLVQVRGLRALPVYCSNPDLDRQYIAGNAACLLTAIEGAIVIDDEKLTWDQVGEFRTDSESKQHLRRMRHWLNSEMIGKPLTFVQDEIALRLDNYERALKKHGIETFAGTLSDLLEPSFLKIAGPAVGALWAGGLWAGAGTGLAEIVAGGLVLGKVTVSLTNRCLNLTDRKRGQGFEVAFVHELKKLSK